MSTRAIHHLQHEAGRSVEGRGGEKTLFLVAGHLKDNGISRDMAHQLIAGALQHAGTLRPVVE